MIFIVLIVLAIIIGAVVLRRAGVGMGGEDGQPESVFETLDEEPTPKNRGKLIKTMRWNSGIPMPDKTEGCFVILTYPSKKDMKESMGSYDHCLIGKSAKDEAAAAAKHLSGAGNATIAKDIQTKKKPFLVALLPCEDYGMDIDDCESALKKVFGDERLVKNVVAAKKK